MKRCVSWVFAFSMGGLLGWGSHGITVQAASGTQLRVQKEWHRRAEVAREALERRPDDWACATRYALMLRTEALAQRNAETDFGSHPELAPPKPEAVFPLLARLDRLAGGDPTRQHVARSFQEWVYSP
jgi:hypothetical protein